LEDVLTANTLHPALFIRDGALTEPKSITLFVVFINSLAGDGATMSFLFFVLFFLGCIAVPP